MLLNEAMARNSTQILDDTVPEKKCCHFTPVVVDSVIVRFSFSISHAADCEYNTYTLLRIKTNKWTLPGCPFKLSSAGNRAVVRVHHGPARSRAIKQAS